MQMPFHPFKPGLRPVEKVDQPNQLSMVFSQQNMKKPNQPETVDPNRARP